MARLQRSERSKHRSEAIRCKHCGHEITAAYCANLRCPGMFWRTARKHHTNVVELRPMVQLQSAAGFVGALYVKETRVVDDCECQGVSVSTISSGLVKKVVMERVSAAARERAQQYMQRGYKVTVSKLLAA